LWMHPPVPIFRVSLLQVILSLEQQKNLQIRRAQREHLTQNSLFQEWKRAVFGNLVAILNSEYKIQYMQEYLLLPIDVS
ncbi:MAG: hypothetical protein EZS28_032441, partial [Streblomastix strix]